ncbi:MAG: hypothetical protein J2P36_26150 [Ktedonobacteraceae bacterium]|nr:hypothetical protein [Ktedonobacteraceae bacterium]
MTEEINKQTLPKRLHIEEQGEWKAVSPNPDDDVFIPTGLYEVQDDNGTPYCTAAQESGIEQWLLGNGYKDTGDGIHYERESEQ